MADPVPRLPGEVLWGPLGEYAEIMLPTTEAPLEFHFGAMAVLLSGLLSGPYVQYGTERLHANQFGILAGTTGVTHKTTAVRAALRTAQRVAGDQLTVIHGAGSREGVLVTLADVKPAGRPVVLRVGEFTGLLKKADNKSTSTLTETLLQLYDRAERLENRLAKDSVVVDQPNVVLLGDTTESYLVETFRSASIGNGLLNRLSIFLGEPGDPIPFPPAPSEHALAAWVEGVREAVSFASALPEVQVDPAARRSWEPVYIQQVHPRQRGADGPVLARLAEHAWKCALLYCLLDRRAAITPDDLEAGWALASYLGDCSLRIASGIGTGEKTALLDRIEQVVQEAGGLIRAGYIRRKLSVPQRGLADHCGGIKRLLDQLVADQRIEYDDPGDSYFADPAA